MDSEKKIKIKKVNSIPEHINEFIENNKDNIIKVYNDEKKELKNKYGILYIKINIEENKVDISYITDDVNEKTDIIQKNMWDDFEKNKKQIIFINDIKYGNFVIDLNDTVENDTLENDTLENDTVENDAVENDTVEND